MPLSLAESGVSLCRSGVQLCGSSRRSFLKGALVAAAGARLGRAEKSRDSLLLAGTQTTGASRGIYAFRWHAATGEPELLGLAAETPMPTFLTLADGGRRVYCANEPAHGPGQVSGFSLDRARNRLIPINVVSSGGAGPCHVAADRTGRVLLAANYGGGSVASFRIASDGSLGEAASLVEFHGSGPNRARQEKSHAHRVTLSPDNRMVLVNDLGGDAIHLFHLDAATAKLTPADPPEWQAEPGSGPRSLRFHPSRRWAYCVNELDSTAEVLEWSGGRLHSIQKVKLRPESFAGVSKASESAIDRRGEFAYFSDRGDDVLASFRIDAATGRLTFMNRVDCGGKVPRHIALDPTERWLLVANQESGGIAVFSRDPKTGRLGERSRNFDLDRPQCLVFA